MIPGGRGAYIKASYSVTAGTVLTVIVGGQGSTWTCGSGGGGGTWVLHGSSLMQVSGGGGGGFQCNALGASHGVDGQITLTGTTGNCDPGRTGYSPLPSAGYGGGTAYYGGGGAGWLSSGASNGGSSYAGSFAGGSPGGGYGGGGGFYMGESICTRASIFMELGHKKLNAKHFFC